MKEQEKTFKRIRALEEELSFANPKRAAKITSELVRLKSAVFN